MQLAARNALKVMQIVAKDVPYIPVFMFPGAWAVKAVGSSSRHLVRSSTTKTGCSTWSPSNGWRQPVRRPADGAVPVGDGS